MTKYICITGVAGFIGSHLSDYFLNLGYGIIGLDNLVTGSLQNIAHLQKIKKFKFINHDISEKIDIDEEIQYILHFASPASPIDYLKIPIETLRANSIGTLNMLELARKKKARILMASTSEIYGDPLVHPQIEEYYGNVSSIGPRSCYDEGKRFMEAITMAYNKVHKVETRIVRIFNTYGPRMRLDDGRVVPAFMGQILRGENITIFGDGKQTRSFCYIEDLIDGIYKLLISNYHLPINIGNPEEITIGKFAQELINLTRSNSKIIYRELPIDDPLKRKPDIRKAQEILNWVPKIDRKIGMKKTLDYFSKLLHSNV